MECCENKVSCLRSREFASSTTTKKHRVLPVHIALVDDHEGVCAAIKELAKSENWTMECYLDGYQAVQRIPSTHPDLVLMDIRMPGLSGIECTRKLKCLAPSVPIVMLTAYSDFENIVFSLIAGAIGFLLKPVSLEQFKDVVSRVMQGSTALCDEAQTALLSFLRPAFLYGLRSVHSERELQIMTCLIQDMSDKEIANRLNIAPNTVHVHLVHLFRLFGVHNRGEAAHKFFEGCISDSCNNCHLTLLDNTHIGKTHSTDFSNQLLFDF